MEADFLEQTKDRDIHLIVCSDAEAILGIGDQGVGVLSCSLLLFQTDKLRNRVLGCVSPLFAICIF